MQAIALHPSTAAQPGAVAPPAAWPARWRPWDEHAARRRLAALQRRIGAAALAQVPAPAALRALRAALAREGLPQRRWHGGTAPAGEAFVQACAVADVAARQTLGLAPHAGQWLGALAMLEGRLAEMATGEGKTLAMALAAAVGALAGLPVHAITANDYLVQRDATQMAPLFTALGLRVAAVLPGQDEAGRRAAWAADIAYTTARELVFDDLRDSLARTPDAGTLAAQVQRLAGEAATVPARRLRGLGLALVDEADSVLLDDATMPLVLSQPVREPALQALLWRAMRLARPLQRDEHFTLPDAGAPQLAEAGRARLDDWADPRTWPSRRERDEWVQQALTALHRLRRDHDYLVADGEVHIIDAVTGRRAEGRQWSHGLHALVALKEGLTPPGETRTLAQTSYQAFFPRYPRLGGMSGTLHEARAELARVYGLGLLRVPLQRPSRRRAGPARAFASAAARDAAVVRRCAGLQAEGRPVLVGTDSLEASEALAAQLRAAGLAVAVLNARQDGAEAEVVARAGEAGRITVATRMAGRGTDIALADGVAGRGGLHVLNCQRNPSARQDRQLVGRSARQGQPGSHEHWHVWAPGVQLVGESRLSRLLRGACAADNRWHVPAVLVRLVAGLAQRRAQARERAQRLALAAQQREQARRLRFTQGRG